MQTAQALPTITTEYDVLGMFLYWFKLKGAKWINDFRLDATGQQAALQRFKAVSAARNAAPTDGSENAANLAAAQAAAQPQQGQQQ